MDAISGYVYSALWFILAIYTFYHAVKNYRFLFLISGFFVFMGGWYLADELLTGIDLFSGVYGYIYKGVAIAVLIVCVVIYLRRRSRQPDAQDNDNAG